MKKYSIVIAVDEKKGIWKNGTLAWHISGDQKYFKTLTTTVKNPAKKNAVVMGRKTWESIPEKYRPLPWRINFILSSSYEKEPQLIQEGVFWCNSFEACHNFISEAKDIESMFIIGGSYLYNLVLDTPCLESIYLTRVYGDFNCDVFFADIPSYFKIKKTSERKEEKGISFQMFHYKNKKAYLPKLLTPSIILGSILFVGLSSYLIYKSFTGTQESPLQESPTTITPSDDEQQEPIPENIPTSEVIPPQEEVPVVEEPIEETPINTNNSLEKNSKGSFQEGFLEENDFVYNFPITKIASIDQKIQEFLSTKNIQYKILRSNVKNNTGENVELVLDYKIISEWDQEIEVLFFDLANGEKLGEETKVYKK